MTIDVETFRKDFPEFEVTNNYPESGVQFWLNTGYLRLPSCVWGNLLDLGVELYTAHNLAIERANQKAALNGGLPGQNVGPLNSKSVSKVSAGYDTAAGTLEGAGNYNLTNYGTRFMELVDIVGVLGIAIVGLPQVGFPGTVTSG